MICYFFVCKTNDMIAFILQPFCSHSIELGLFCIVVIASINFYDESFRQTNEVGNIITYRMLPSEVNPTS